MSHVIDWLDADRSGGCVYTRTYYRRPGCVQWLAFCGIALCLAGIPSRLASQLHEGASLPVYVMSFVLIVWGLGRLVGVAARVTVPICPHCGVDTDARFRVCRSCGRVKHA